MATTNRMAVIGMSAKTAAGAALDALATEAGDAPRARGESDDSVRERLLLLVEAAEHPERDPDRTGSPEPPAPAMPRPRAPMALRDHFAAAALTGLVTRGEDSDDVPAAAFRLADAMLAAR